MTRHYIGPDGTLVNEVGTSRYIGPSGTIFIGTTDEGGGGATINLTASNTAFGLTSGTGEADIDPPAAGTVNLAGADTTFGLISGIGLVDIDSAMGTITSDVFTSYSGIAQLAETIPITTILNLDGSNLLVLEDLVTNGTGQLVITNAALSVGTDYMMANFDPDETDSNIQKRGFKRYTAS